MMRKNSEEAAKVLTMNILISNLDVPADLLHFDSINEEFYWTNIYDIVVISCLSNNVNIYKEINKTASQYKIS